MSVEIRKFKSGEIFVLKSIYRPGVLCKIVFVDSVQPFYRVINLSTEERFWAYHEELEPLENEDRDLVGDLSSVGLL
jgi:hypothetical protein